MVFDRSSSSIETVFYHRDPSLETSQQPEDSEHIGAIDRVGRELSLWSGDEGLEGGSRYGQVMKGWKVALVMVR